MPHDIIQWKPGGKRIMDAETSAWQNRIIMVKLYGWGNAKGNDSIKVVHHTHDFYQTNWCLSDGCEFITDSAVYNLKKGDLIFVAPETWHSMKYHSPYLSYCFKFRAHMPDFPPVLYLPSSPFTEGMIKAAETILNTTFPEKYFGCEPGVIIVEEDHYQHVIEYFLAGVLTMILHNKNKYMQGPLRRIYEIIDMNNGKYVPVSELAEACNYSRNHFSALVKNLSGVPAKNFVDHVRTDIAKRYLYNSSLRINEISERMGFASQFHFSAFFKRMTGLSPLQYRNCNAQER